MDSIERKKTKPYNINEKEILDIVAAKGSYLSSISENLEEVPPHKESSSRAESKKTITDEEEQVELYKKMETLLCDDAANLYIEDMACEVALRSDFAGYRFYPLYVQDMAKIYKVK